MGVIALLLAGCSSDPFDSPMSSPDSVPAATAPPETSTTLEEVDSTAVDAGQVLLRLADRRASYHLDMSCITCFFGGRYDVQEQDGRIVSVDPPAIEGQPFPDGWSLSEVLARVIVDPAGYSLRVSDDGTSVSLDADPDRDAIDDEFTYRVSGLVLSDRVVGLRDGEADCRDRGEADLDLDAEPLSWRANTQVTFTRGGCAVRVDVLGGWWGSDHCGTQYVEVLMTGSALGRPRTGAADTRYYVKDPNDALGLAEGFDASATLGPDAVDTGYRNGFREIWLVPGDDAAIYVVDFDQVQRWPSAASVPSCD